MFLSLSRYERIFMIIITIWPQPLAFYFIRTSFCFSFFFYYLWFFNYLENTGKKETIFFPLENRSEGTLCKTEKESSSLRVPQYHLTSFFKSLLYSVRYNIYSQWPFTKIQHKTKQIYPSAQINRCFTQIGRDQFREGILSVFLFHAVKIIPRLQVGGEKRYSPVSINIFFFLFFSFFY